MNQHLESAIAKIRAMPDERQRDAAELLEALIAAGGSPYRLSEDERAVLEPALARAERGEVAAESEVATVLREPWR